MTPKTIIFIIAVIIIMLVTFAAGLHAGKRNARQACLDRVAENCDYICGVGADFYYPDKQTSPRSEDPELEERMVAFRNDNS